MVSVIMFLAAILLFMGLFNQTIQTAVIYQQHSALSTKTSDLLDNMLLSSGNPTNWSETAITSSSPTGFGLQDNDFSQYALSPFALMRLCSSTGTPINYQMDGTTTTYSNNTMSFGQSLLVPYSDVLNYSLASKLLGINGSYSFSLTVAPTVNVAISAVPSQPTLTLSLNVSGPGFPLANAKVNYCLITVTGKDAPNKPIYNIINGVTSADAAGLATVSFPSVDVTHQSYALIASASLSGLSGVGYYSNSLTNSTYVVPLVSSFETGTIDLAHSWGIIDDANQHAGEPGDLYYNATFLRATDMTEMTLTNGTVGGNGVYGKLNVAQIPSHSNDTLTLDSNNLGVLVVAYSMNSSASGIVVMPWGFSPLGFSVTFGVNPLYLTTADWVSTDIRQVLINNVPYQAKLSLWSNAGHQVIT